MVYWEAGFCPNCNRNLALFYVTFTLLHSRSTVPRMHFFPRSWCLARVVHLQNKGRCNSQAHTRHYSKCQYWNIFHCGYGHIRGFFFYTLQTNNLHKKVTITDIVEKWHFVFIYSWTPFVASTLFNPLVCLFVCVCVSLQRLGLWRSVWQFTRL